MMDRSVYRVHDLASEIAEQHARIRELIARASEVLKLPKSDTVLSRKTQKPFPMREDP